jgi:ubiquinone biosynthesis protein
MMPAQEIIKGNVALFGCRAAHNDQMCHLGHRIGPVERPLRAPPVGGLQLSWYRAAIPQSARLALASPFDLFRLARAGWTLAREGAFGLVEIDEISGFAWLVVHGARLIERRGVGGAEGLAKALTRLGPSWVKLGQFLATRPDVVGIAVARDLEMLQDRMAPFSRAVAIQEIERALGGPLSAHFVDLSEPVAAASVAQVHKASVRDADGERVVAVKVLRPGIVRRFHRDLSTFYFAARAIERFDPRARRLRPVEVVDTLARTVAFEMDLRLEAAALSEMSENVAEDPNFRVPLPDWTRTARTVLTLEWIDAIPLSDVARLKAAGFDLAELGRTVIQSFLRHAIRDGFFHADMHQGNLMVDAAGELVAVDFGIMGRAGWKERHFLAEILHGFITRDYRRVAAVHFEAGYVPATHSVEDFAQALRAIGEPIHQKRADEISMAKLLTLLFEVTELFDMRTRPELILLQKTMVVVEGVARRLDPRLDIWTTAEPVVREWIERNLGPLGKLGELSGAARDAAKALGTIPSLLARAENLTQRLDLATQHGFSLSAESIEAIARAKARRARWGHVALWAIAAVLATIAWRLIG